MNTAEANVKFWEEKRAFCAKKVEQSKSKAAVVRWARRCKDADANVRFWKRRAEDNN